MQELRIALVSRNHELSAPDDWNRYGSASELQNDALAADVVVLELSEARARQELMALRQDDRYRLALIYVSGLKDCRLVLADGSLPESWQEIGKAYAQLQQRLAAFNQGRAPSTLEERIMAWLWTRPQSGLVACRDTTTPQVYSYSLIQAFAGNEPVNETLWLRLMCEHGWLAADELVDRVRLCTRCNSAHLNHVDVCPECKDLDITRQQALRCLGCKHVASQEEFLKGGMLLCPNCLTRLSQLGSDYERPQENLSCRACNAFFAEPEVQVRCLDCEHIQQLDDLRIREVRNHHLTERGRLRCRQGFSEEFTSEYFSRLSLISVCEFHALLDWQIQQANRYKDTPPCSLLALRFDGMERLLETREGQATLDSLVEHIEQVIRETDRCTRSRADLLWTLLPHTNRRGALALRVRLASIAEQLEVGGFKVKLRVAALTLPEDLVAGETAQLMMGRLAGEIG